MKVLLVLAAIAAVSSGYRYRPNRDIGLSLRGQIQTSYSSDNDLYVPPVSTNHVPQGYDYAKPAPTVQRPLPGRLYVPASAPPPTPTIRNFPPLEPNFLPVETISTIKVVPQPNYSGKGPYIWDYVSEGAHKVDVQDPYHQYRVHFDINN